MLGNSWRIDDKTDAVHVIRAGKGLPSASIQELPPLPVAGPSQRELLLPLPPIPAVSERAKDTFRKLYPKRDAERCLADFAAWLSHKGHTADKPDAAFLGFAKKWATNR